MTGHGGSALLRLLHGAAEETRPGRAGSSRPLGVTEHQPDWWQFAQGHQRKQLVRIVYCCHMFVRINCLVRLNDVNILFSHFLKL